MSQPSLATYIVKRPWLKKMMMPLSNWYCNAAGYRKLGLRYAHLLATPALNSTESIDGRAIWVYRWKRC